MSCSCLMKDYQSMKESGSNISSSTGREKRTAITEAKVPLELVDWAHGIRRVDLCV